MGTISGMPAGAAILGPGTAGAMRRGAGRPTGRGRRRPRLVAVMAPGLPAVGRSARAQKLPARPGQAIADPRRGVPAACAPAGDDITAFAAPTRDAFAAADATCGAIAR